MGQEYNPRSQVVDWIGRLKATGNDTYGENESLKRRALTAATLLEEAFDTTGVKATTITDPVALANEGDRLFHACVEQGLIPAAQAVNRALTALTLVNK